MRKSSIDIRTSTRLKGTALAVALAALSFSVGVQARGLTHPVDPDYTGRVSVTGVAYPGETVDVTGSGFKPGQQVQLLSDGATITTQAILSVDAEGRIAGQVEIPPESPVGIHPVVVQTVNPGRAPVKQSSLMKVNPSSLAVEHQVTPPADSTGKGLEAVYGVAVDDTAGTVWTGNTRTGAVAVYKQDDLSLVKQFPDKLAPHNHGVLVDGPRHRAYVAAHGKNYVSVFNTQTLEHKVNLTLESPTRTKTPPAPLGFALDQDGGKLFVVSTTDQVYVIDEPTEKIEKVYNLKGAKGAISIAYAPEEKLLFVVSQSTDNLQILDATDGKLKADVKVGAGPLAVVWEPVRKLAYVANRGSDSVAVVDVNGNLVANLPGGSYTNHVFTDGKGTVWSVNKARGLNDPQGDHISRYAAK